MTINLLVHLSYLFYLAMQGRIKKLHCSFFQMVDSPLNRVSKSLIWRINEHLVHFRLGIWINARPFINGYA